MARVAFREDTKKSEQNQCVAHKRARLRDASGASVEVQRKRDLPLAAFRRYAVAPTPTGSNTTFFRFRFASRPAIVCTSKIGTVAVPRFRTRQPRSFESAAASAETVDMIGEAFKARVRFAQSFWTTVFCAQRVHEQHQSLCGMRRRHPRLPVKMTSCSGWERDAR